MKKPEQFAARAGRAGIHLPATTRPGRDYQIGQERGTFHGVVAAAAIHHHDLRLGRHLSQVAQESADKSAFIQNRNYDGNTHQNQLYPVEPSGAVSKQPLMKIFNPLALTCSLLFCLQVTALGVDVPSGIDHASYDRLLKKYVNGEGLVAYGKWKESAEDRKTLDDYVAQFSGKGAAANGSERHASLINAYNSLVLKWILDNYPTESIWALKSSFKTKRHQVGGTSVSLDDIENGALRPEFGYRTHAVLVCAARSCPPLQTSAYTAGQLDEQVARAYRAWLGRADLNEFSAEKNEASISSIFKWFKGDFEKGGGVKSVIAKYGPASAQTVMKKPDSKLTYKTYNWGLNDQ